MEPRLYLQPVDPLDQSLTYLVAYLLHLRDPLDLSCSKPAEPSFRPCFRQTVADLWTC